MKNSYFNFNAATLMVCFFFVAFATQLQAQTSAGIFGGFNLSNLKIENSESDYFTYENKNGYKVGGLFDFSLTNQLSLRLQPMYLQKGAIQKFSDQDVITTQPTEFKLELAMNYVELPVLFKFDLSKGKIRPYLLGGGEIGYLLKATEQDLTYQGEKLDATSRFKRWDYGVTFGAGVELPFLKKSSFFVEARNSIGLADVNNMVFSDHKITTNGMQLMAGFKIPLFPNMLDSDSESKEDCNTDFTITRVSDQARIMEEKDENDKKVYRKYIKYEARSKSKYKRNPELYCNGSCEEGCEFKGIEWKWNIQANIAGIVEGTQGIIDPNIFEVKFLKAAPRNFEYELTVSAEINCNCETITVEGETNTYKGKGDELK